MNPLILKTPAGNVKATSVVDNTSTQAWQEAFQKVFNAGYEAGQAENLEPAKNLKTIRNAAGRAVGVIVLKSKRVESASQIVWKFDGKRLKAEGTLSLELPKGTTVASATAAILAASAGLIEPPKPTFIVSRSDPDGDQILI